MGHGVTTYAAPHVITAYHQSEDWHLAITERESWIDQEQDQICEDAGGGNAGEMAVNAWTPPNTYDINGWIVKKRDDPKIDSWETLKRKGIYASILRKGDKTVYVLNSSEYNNVGEHQLTVFADNLDALLTFCQDVGLDITNIESPGVVEQWG